MAFTPSSEWIASIFDERPYLAQWARARSAACWRVIPVIGIVPPTSLPATFVIRQPDSVRIAATPSNIAAMSRFMLALSPSLMTASIVTAFIMTAGQGDATNVGGDAASQGQNIGKKKVAHHIDRKYEECVAKAAHSSANWQRTMGIARSFRGDRRL
jgi:hypothetical protein